MIRALKAAVLCALFASPVLAKNTISVEVKEANGAVLRGLDKVSGIPVDLPLSIGQTVALGWLQITLGDCRYPVDNAVGDAFAWLVVRERDAEVPIFEGWMIASSPGLNALDHPRFDVWVIRCTTE